MPASIPVLECLPACLHRNACKHSCARMPASIPAQECLQGTPAPARLHRHAPREYRERPARVPREQHPAPGAEMTTLQCLHSNVCTAMPVQALLCRQCCPSVGLHSNACTAMPAQALLRRQPQGQQQQQQQGQQQLQQLQQQPQQHRHQQQQQHQRPRQQQQQQQQCSARALQGF